MRKVLAALNPAHLRILHIEPPVLFDCGLPLIPVTFPSLNELKFTGNLSESMLTNSVVAPALEKLYLLVEYGHLKNIAAELKRICPRLAYLRATAGSGSLRGDALLQFLHTYSGAGHSVKLHEHRSTDSQVVRSTHGGGLDSIPRRLRRIVVEFRPIMAPRCGNGYMGLLDGRNAYYRTHEGGTPVKYVEECDTDKRAEENSGDSDSKHRGVTFGERSLWVVPAPPFLRGGIDSDQKEVFIAQMQVAKKHWLETSTGRGKGWCI